MKKAFWFLCAGLFLSGCGEDLKSFNCSKKDFETLESRAAKVSATSDESMFSGTYDMVKAWNQKIADVCPAEVLKVCAPGNTEAKVARSGYISGPVTALGISASIEVREVYSHDGFARTRDYQFRYITSLNREKFRRTLACFKSRAHD